MKHVIIGNGVAGINAALEIRRCDPAAEIIIISAETEYFYSRTALMYIAMHQMRLEETEPLARKDYPRRNLELIKGQVERIDPGKHTVHLAAGRELVYDKLLLATGSRPATYGWPGLDLIGVLYMVSYQHLEDIMRQLRPARKIPRPRKAVVVGGGLIGIEMVEVFLHHGLEVDFVIKDDRFWRGFLSPREGAFVHEILRAQGVNLRLETKLESITGREGRVTGIVTAAGEEIACDLVGLATGVVPVTDLARAAGIDCGKGILTDWQLKTSAPDVFAAGDCTEIRVPGEERNFLLPIWYAARDMGLTAGRNMMGQESPFEPGIFYNSAKFFDEEYTAVGRVHPALPGMEEFEYTGRDFSLRIVCDSGGVQGFSLIGGRWDHEILLGYIREKCSLEDVLADFAAVAFVPELSPSLSRPA